MRKFCAHIGYMFSEIPLRGRFEAAKRAGFAGVEHPTPHEIPATELKRIVDALDLVFVQCALPVRDAGAGGKGMAALPDCVAPFRDSVAKGLDYATAAGVRFVHVLSGVRSADMPWERMWETYIENVAFAADAAAKRDLKIIIEPIGSATLANYFMDDAALGTRALAEIGRANVGLLFDAFHATVAALDPADFVHRHGSVISHVHIADHPGRHEPGTGTIDFERFYGALDRAGYRGMIGCEYKPAGETIAGLGWLAGHRQIAAVR